MSESESAFPLDSSIWEHIGHMDYSIGIPVSDKRVLNILGALEDIYYTIDKDPDDAKQLIVSMAAILTAVRHGKADKVFEEFVVQDTMKRFDKGIEEILNETP